jgi:hypothetical protein
MTKLDRMRRSKTMTHLPVSRELQPLTQSRSSPSPQTTWRRVIAAINGPDFLIIVVVCLLGLLLTLNFMFRNPDIGDLIQQYNLF